MKDLVSDGFANVVKPYIDNEIAAVNQTLTNKLSDEIETRAMLSAHNLFDVGDFSEWFAAGSDGKLPLEYPASATITATLDKNTNSITVTNYDSTGYRWGCKKVNLKKNTRYVFSFASITGTMRLFGKNDADAQATLIANLPATVNTGNYDTYYVGFYPTVGGGYFTATNMLVKLETDADLTFQPYAMTNRELTENYNIKRAVVSVPATYHGGSVANINFEKRNGVVRAYWAGGTPTFPAQGTEYEIGDIPEGFIPSQVQTGYGVDMNSFTRGMYLQLRTNGKIYIFGYNTGTGGTVNALVSLVYFA